MRRPSGRADRDVLQVRVAGREPSRHRDRLVIRGVHAAGLRVDLLGQLLGVGGAELRESPVFQDDARQLVFLREFLEHFLRRGGLARAGLLPDGKALFREQDFLQLLRRVEVERLAGGLVRLHLEFGEPFREFAALFLQQFAVDQHAVVLHLEQDRHERLLDLLVDLEERRLLLERSVQDVVQLQRDVGVLGGVGRGLLECHLVERDLLRALAGDVLVLDRVDAKVELRAGIHVVARRGRVQDVGLEHRVVAHAGKVDAAHLRDVRVVLEVVADFRPLRRPRGSASASRGSSCGPAGPARRDSRERAGGRRPCRVRCRRRRRRFRLACSRGSSSRCRRRRAVLC